MGNEIADAQILYSAVDLSREEERVFEAAIQELPSLLQQSPLEIDVSVARLDGELRDEVLDVLRPCDDLATGNARLFDFIRDRFEPWPGVYLACPKEHEFARASLRANSDIVLTRQMERALGLHRIDRRVP